MKYLALGLIRLYQLCLRPMLGDSCRFYPSCSEYAYEAFCQKGFCRGLWLTVKRLFKCHPWHPGGHDPLC